jgi:VanZ family protein
VKREPFALGAWLPVVFWSAIIALESAEGSSANTGSILETLAVWLFGHVDPARFAAFHHILRKSGHFLGYGILGYLWFRAFMRTLPTSRRLTCAFLAIACTFLIASLDEWHQSFSPGRAGSFRDVVLDTVGSFVLVSLAMAATTRRRKAGVALR